MSIIKLSFMILIPNDECELKLIQFKSKLILLFNPIIMYLEHDDHPLNIRIGG